MIRVKTSQEIAILAEGGRILAFVLDKVSQKVRPGIAARELDDLAYNLIKKAGGTPAFLGYRGRGEKEAYPASLCVSINDEVVHGLPSDEKILKEGDIVSLDLGLQYKKFYTDMAVTLGVGKISRSARKLIDVTKQSLSVGIKELKEGNRLGDYGFLVQTFVEKNGFNVVRNLVGHGVGQALHEEPDIPNWGKKGTGLELKAGMILALEPMVCEGRPEVKIAKDGWAWKTRDGLLSAHFEHTVVVGKEGAEVLTKLK